MGAGLAEISAYGQSITDLDDPADDDKVVYSRCGDSKCIAALHLAKARR